MRWRRVTLKSKCCIFLSTLFVFIFDGIIINVIILLCRTCRKINAQYFRGSPTFYVDSGMNIYLGVNTLNQFQSYSTPYPVESPMVRPYDYQDKHAVANPVYVEQNTPPVVPVMVTAHVVQPTEEEPPPEQSARHAQVSPIYMCFVMDITCIVPPILFRTILCY